MLADEKFKMEIFDGQTAGGNTVCSPIQLFDRMNGQPIILPSAGACRELVPP
jgi:hypothetical protein